MSLSPDLHNELKANLTDLITCVQCPICRKLLRNPSVAQCGHVACKSCWLPSSKCHSCKSKITDKDIVPNKYVDEIKEAAQLILKSFEEEYGISVDVISSSAESSCDWFHKAPMENPKKYANRKRTSIADSDKLLSISQNNSPLIFAGENLDDTFNPSKSGNMSMLDTKTSADKVKNWLKTSENAFIEPSEDISLMNIDIKPQVDSPSKKKRKLTTPKLVKNMDEKGLRSKNITDPVSEISIDTSCNLEPVTNNASMSKSLINDIIGVPEEKLNKDKSWDSVKKMKKVLKKSRNTRKLKLNTNVSKNSSKESLEMHNTSEDVDIVDPHSIIENIPELPKDGDELGKNKELETDKANISYQPIKDVETPNIEIDEIIQDSSKLPKYTYSKISKTVTVPEKLKHQLSSTNNSGKCISENNLIDLPCSQEKNVLEVNYERLLSVSPCEVQPPKVPFIFKGILPKKSINSKPHKVNFFYKSRCGVKENSENLQDGINITISSDSLITSIFIRNQQLQNVPKSKDFNVTISNVKDAQTSPIPIRESDVFFNENQELCISTLNKNNNDNVNHETHHEISENIQSVKDVKQIEDQCPMEDFDILFTSSPIEVDNAVTLSREPSVVLLTKRTFAKKSQESKVDVESSTQFSKDISQLDFIPNTEFVPNMMDRMKIDRNSGSKISGQSLKVPSSKVLSQQEHDKTDTQLMSMEIDNDLRSSGNIFAKSAASNDFLENKEKSKTSNEKTLELLPEEEILLTPSLTVSQSKAMDNNLGNMDISDVDIVENTPQKPRKIGLAKKQEEITKSQSQINTSALIVNESLNKDNSMFVNLNTEAFLSEKREQTIGKEQTLNREAHKKNETPLNVKSFEESVKYRSTPFDDVRARRSLDYNKLSKIEEDFDNHQSNELSLGSTSHIKTMIEKEFLEQALNATDTTLVPSVLHSEIKNRNEQSNKHANSFKLSQRKISVACSLLSGAKVQAVKKFIKGIGGEFYDTYEKKLTHLIVSVDENNTCHRSVKYIRALAAGIWILSYEWVVDCVKSNSIVSEEKYEVLDSSGEEGPKINRAGKTKLFHNFTFYCMPPFSLLSEQVLADILETAGGKVVKTIEEICIKHPKQLHVLLGEPEDTQEQRFLVMCLKYPIVPVNLEWALGSLGEGRTDGAAAWFLAPKRLLPTIDWPDNLMEDDSSDE